MHATTSDDRTWRVPGAGHLAFALTMMALGCLGLCKGQFTPVWEPVPKWVPVQAILIYACAALSLGCGVGLLWRRSSAAAARVVLAALLLWFLLTRVPYLFLAPATEGSWSGCAETAVMVAAAWVLYAWFAPDVDRRRLGFATGKKGLRVARTLYGLALLPFGVAHFVYPQATAALVPGWLPWHLVWVYFTGGTFIAAGAAVLSGVCGRVAAALSAWQIGLFALLVWVPIVAAGTKDPFLWNETTLSFALTAGTWVVADSWREPPRILTP